MSKSSQSLARLASGAAPPDPGTKSGSVPGDPSVSWRGESPTRSDESVTRSMSPARRAGRLLALPWRETRRPWTATRRNSTCATCATSASSPTSTPARRRRPSGSSTTPARSTGWGTSTRETRRPTTSRKSGNAGSPSSRRRSPATGRMPRAADHDQHHRHAGPRRLHRRGRAVAPRARRRRRRLLGRRGGRGPERDRLAAGRQVPRPADLLHQQDGPHRRRVRAGLPGNRGAAAREPPHPGPDPHRRRAGGDDGRVPGPDRPDRDEGPLLQDRGPGLDHHRDEIPEVAPRRGRALAREDAQLPCPTWTRSSPRPTWPTSTGPS